MSVKPDVSIIIACYNEAGHLRDSVDEIKKTMAATNYTYELIFVDDYSKDETREIIKSIASENENVSYMFNEKNCGRGASVKRGLEAARGDIAGFLDIDLEVHCRYIPSMIQTILEGADIACGHRVYNIPFSIDDFFRNILSLGYRVIVRALLGLTVMDSEAGYKFFNMKTTKALIELTENNHWFWDTEVIALAQRRGLQVGEVPMVYIRRADKKSTVKPLLDVGSYIKSLFIYRRRFRKSINYRSTFVYNATMKLIYHKNFDARYEEISDLIPEGASVLDACCGDARLYTNFLKKKNVSYTGLDINRGFIKTACAAGVDARLTDVLISNNLPSADYVVLQSSLYQFIPRHDSVLRKLAAAARIALIIAEPVKNLGGSSNPILKWAGRAMNNPGTGTITHRFSHESIAEALKPYKIVKTQEICGGREMLFVIEPNSRRECAADTPEHA